MRPVRIQDFDLEAGSVSSEAALCAGENAQPKRLSRRLAGMRTVPRSTVVGPPASTRAQYSRMARPRARRSTVRLPCLSARPMRGRRRPVRTLSTSTQAGRHGGKIAIVGTRAGEGPNYRHAFVDIHYDTEEEFCRRLLESGDFSARALRAAREGKDVGADKPAMARSLATAMLDDRLDAGVIVREACRDSRGWLALRIGPVRHKRPKLPSPKQFLTAFGTDNWYGPIDDGATCYFIAAREAFDFRVDRETQKLRRYRVRWHVVGEVTDTHAAFHWNGFSLNEDRKRPQAPGQYPFWKHLPQMIEDLGAALGAQWSEPELGPLVLDDLWSRYAATHGYVWTHKRLRAERDGVALNAHSASKRMAGLEALTRSLAGAATDALKVTDTEQIRAVEAALLRRLVQDGGAKSYEFSLDEDNQEQKPLFRAHCYFGGRPKEFGQDSFQHLNCYGRYGGSRGAAEFLFRHLEGIEP